MVDNPLKLGGGLYRLLRRSAGISRAEPMTSGATLQGRFGVTTWDISYDINTGQLLHYMKIRLDVTLEDDRDGASARALLEVLDPQGVVLQSRIGAVNFVRIPLEPFA
jgi:hypothetical protein